MEKIKIYPFLLVGKGINVFFPTCWKRYKLEKLSQPFFSVVVGIFHGIIYCSHTNHPIHQPTHPGPRRGGSLPLLETENLLGWKVLFFVLFVLVSYGEGCQVRKRRFKKVDIPIPKFDLSTLWTYLQNNHIHFIHL